MTSPAKTPARAAGAAARSVRTRRMGVRRRGLTSDLQPGRDAGVSASGRTGRHGVRHETLGASLLVPGLDLGGAPRLVPPELGAEGRGDALGGAPLELARGQ